MQKRIRKWVDGDTGRFSTGEFFRLANVRAPEHYQYGGKTATRTAAGMSGRSHGIVNVKVYGKDHYNRFLVELFNKNGSINQRMRKKGYTNKGF